MCLAIPGRIVETDGGEEFRSGMVDFNGVKKQVSLALVPEAQVGDYVLVHVGVALNTVDEEEARRTFEILRQMEELDEIR
jgi:hydrogenase expression/formation protein HypC